MTVALATIMAAASVGVATVPSQGAAAYTCNGRVATIVGNAGANELHGTSGSDVIVGLGGNDDIEGRAGNDVICGNRGNDEVEGDRGDDGWPRPQRRFAEETEEC